MLRLMLAMLLGLALAGCNAAPMASHPATDHSANDGGGGGSGGGGY